jgi:hypothetical protein
MKFIGFIFRSPRQRGQSWSSAQRQYFAVKRHTTLICILQPAAAGNLGAVGAAPAPVVPPHARSVNTVRLPSTDQFSTTYKTKECAAHRQTTKLLAIPHCVPYWSTTFHKSNASVSVQNITLFNLPTGPFIALGAHEWTARTVSIIQDNTGLHMT